MVDVCLPLKSIEQEKTIYKQYVSMDTAYVRQTPHPLKHPYKAQSF